MDLNLWCIQVTDVVALVSSLPHKFRELRQSLPKDGSPSERLARLVTFWLELGAESPNLYCDPPAAAVSNLGPYLGDSQEAKYIKEDYGQLLWQVYAEISRALEQGGEDPRIIYQRAFATFGRIPSESGQGLRSAFILVSPRELPAGHYVKDLLPGEQLYDGSFLVLGGPRSMGPIHTDQNGETFTLPELTAQPHSWYFTSTAISLTRNLEAQRIRKKAEKDREEAILKERRRQAWLDSEGGLRARIQKLEEQLEAEGQPETELPAFLR